MVDWWYFLSDVCYHIYVLKLRDLALSPFSKDLSDRLELRNTPVFETMVSYLQTLIEVAEKACKTVHFAVIRKAFTTSTKSSVIRILLGHTAWGNDLHLLTKGQQSLNPNQEGVFSNYDFFLYLCPFSTPSYM